MGECGKTHTGSPSYSFRDPTCFYDLPDADRDERVLISDDICHIRPARDEEGEDIFLHPHHSRDPNNRCKGSLHLGRLGNATQRKLRQVCRNLRSGSVLVWQLWLAGGEYAILQSLRCRCPFDTFGMRCPLGNKRAKAKSCPLGKHAPACN
ncbi:DUF2199 domain-containing protein [Ruegeria sp. R8_1]|nr:DUF2199 domain-containing protein [Ruegeria sp. R8_1]